MGTRHVWEMLGRAAQTEWDRAWHPMPAGNEVNSSRYWSKRAEDAVDLLRHLQQDFTGRARDHADRAVTSTETIDPGRSAHAVLDGLLAKCIDAIRASIQGAAVRGIDTMVRPLAEKAAATARRFHDDEVAQLTMIIRQRGALLEQEEQGRKDEKERKDASDRRDKHRLWLDIVSRVLSAAIGLGGLVGAALGHVATGVVAVTAALALLGNL